MAMESERELLGGSITCAAPEGNDAETKALASHHIGRNRHQSVGQQYSVGDLYGSHGARRHIAESEELIVEYIQFL